eukprot:Rmarinus@m.16473
MAIPLTAENEDKLTLIDTIISPLSTCISSDHSLFAKTVPLLQKMLTSNRTDWIDRAYNILSTQLTYIDDLIPLTESIFSAVQSGNRTLLSCLLPLAPHAAKAFAKHANILLEASSDAAYGTVALSILPTVAENEPSAFAPHLKCLCEKMADPANAVFVLMILEKVAMDNFKAVTPFYDQVLSVGCGDNVVYNVSKVLRCFVSSESDSEKARAVMSDLLQVLQQTSPTMKPAVLYEIAHCPTESLRPWLETFSSLEKSADPNVQKAAEHIVDIIEGRTVRHVSTKVDAVSERVEHVDLRVDNVSDRVQVVTDTVAVVKQDVEEVVSDLSNVNDNVKQVQDSLVSATDRIQHTEARVDIVEKDVSEATLELATHSEKISQVSDRVGCVEHSVETMIDDVDVIKDDVERVKAAQEELRIKVEYVEEKVSRAVKDFDEVKAYLDSKLEEMKEFFAQVAKRLPVPYNFSTGREPNLAAIGRFRDQATQYVETSKELLETEAVASAQMVVDGAIVSEVAYAKSRSALRTIVDKGVNSLKFLTGGGDYQKLAESVIGGMGGAVLTEIRLHFKCCRNGDSCKYTELHDFRCVTKQVNKWLKVALSGVQLGFSVMNGSVSGAVAAVKCAYDAANSEYESNFMQFVSQPFLTSAEEDDLIHQLRQHQFFAEFTYDATCAGWACVACKPPPLPPDVPATDDTSCELLTEVGSCTAISGVGPPADSTPAAEVPTNPTDQTYKTTPMATGSDKTTMGSSSTTSSIVDPVSLSSTDALNPPSSGSAAPDSAISVSDKTLLPPGGSSGSNRKLPPPPRIKVSSDAEDTITPVSPKKGCSKLCQVM